MIDLLVVLDHAGMHQRVEERLEDVVEVALAPIWRRGVELYRQTALSWPVDSVENCRLRNQRAIQPAFR